MGGGANRARGRGAGAPEGDESARGGGGDSARAPALVRTPKDKAPPSRRGGGRAGVRGRGAGHWAWGLGKPAGARRADSTSEGGREPLREGGGGIPPSSESAGRRPTVRVPGGGEGVSEAGGAEPGARTGPEATEAREGSALTPVEETPKQGPAGRTGRGPQWGAGLGTEGGTTTKSWGRGGWSSIAGVRLRGTKERGGGGRGRTESSSHSPLGGRRRRRSRSPCSGWGAAAVGVQRPEYRHRTVGLLGAGGSGGRVGPGQTGEGSPRQEVMGARRDASRSELCAPRPATPRPSRVSDAAPAAGEAGESLREGGGGGGGGGSGSGSEREPDRLPDLTPSSARVSGGRAGDPRRLSGNVV